MSRTLAIIKPDAVNRGNVGAIISDIEAAGFGLHQITVKHFTREEAEEFYAEHRGRIFFERQVNFMCSGPCVVLVLEHPAAVTRWRRLLGKTDPEEAYKLQPLSIRGRYGTELPYNAAHGSDSVDGAKKEIEFFFGDLESSEGITREVDSDITDG